MQDIGIYVHIPFCKQKCKYCDFVSFSNMEEKFDEYFKYLIIEIEEKAQENKSNFENGIEDLIRVDTIYIGGGTPSIVKENYIEDIINVIKTNFKIVENPEITIEINPGTVNKNKLQKYYDIGINRLSIGLQSTNDNLLKMLGRIHTYTEFENTYDLAKEIGFNNINVDLMIGLPNQSISDVEESINKIVKKSPEHISVYSLIIEENTQMYDMIKSGILAVPDESIERQMYWNVKKMLEEAGYKHYEISNFAKISYESKHNFNCWEQHSYLGFGVAAHSYFNGIRYSNTDNLKTYIDNWKNGQGVHNSIVHENQTKDEMMSEYMLLGLRKIDGVNINKFKNKFVCNPIYVFRNELNKLVNNGLVVVNENRISLTDKGLDLANVVWMEFV